MRRANMTVLALLIALLPASCRGSDPSGTTAAPTTTTAPMTTAVPTAESSGAQPLTMGTFALPDGWHQYRPEDVDEIALGGPSADMNVTRPSRVLDPETATVDAPEEMADWLLNHSRFEATEAESAQVAGIESRVIDIEGPAGTVEFFAYPEGNMRVPAGVAARFVVVPMDGPDLVLIVLPSAETLADAIDATQSIVDSLAIVDGP